MPFTIDGVPYDAIGSNDADNLFDSSNVAANADGSVLERLEYIQTVVDANQPVTFTPSSAPVVDEDGGRAAVHVSIVDRNTGQVASASIDITGITYELARSTGGGAFSTVGVTQPSGATKADGAVELEFDFDAAEWAVGDAYRLKLGGVTATVGGTPYYMGTLAWVGEVTEDLDVKTTVDLTKTDTTAILEDTGTTIPATLGAPAGASISADIAAVKADTAAVLEDTGTTLPATLGTPAGASISADIASIEAKTTNLPASPASTGEVEAGPTVPAADAVANTGARDVVGNKTDAAVESVGTTASLVAYTKGLVNNVGAWTAPALATVSCAASTTTTLLAEVATTTPTEVVVNVDISNLTVSATIDVLVDGGAAGTTATVLDRLTVDPTASPYNTVKLVPIQFYALADYSVRITTGAEGASRDVYVRDTRRVTG